MTDATTLLALGADSGSRFNPNLDINSLDLRGMESRVATKRRPASIHNSVKAGITEAVTDAVISRTIEGASTLTLTVHDPGWAILNLDIFSLDDEGRLSVIDVRVDDLWFRLVKISPSGDFLTLTFEDREVALLRLHDKPRSVSRADKTRAQFAEIIVREVKTVRITFHSPEKLQRQAIASKSKTPKNADSERHDNERGLHRGADITVKGQKPDAAQRRNIETVMRRGDKENAPLLAKRAMLCGAIGESAFIAQMNLAGSPYGGVFGGLIGSNQYGSHLFALKDTDGMAKHFLRGGKGFQQGGAIALARKHPSMSPGEIAYRVEGSLSNFSSAGAAERFYGQWADEANKIIDAWGDGNNGDDSATITKTKQYRFARGSKGEREDSWTCLLRLAEEVGWRCFMRNGEVWFISEPKLLEQKSQIVLKREDDSLDSDSVSFDWDINKRIKSVSFDIDAKRWAVPPGSIVSLRRFGTASGRWIVASVERSLFGTKTSVELVKATKPKPEPANETTTKTVDREQGGDGNSDAEKIYERALDIHEQDLPYVYGGGHAKVGHPSGGGYDCSAYCGAALYEGGAWPDNWTSVPASGTLAQSYGKPGKGKFVTLWCNGGHAFLEFHNLPRRRYRWADTSQQAGGPPGPHMRKGNRSTAGFTARHWPGL